MLESCDHSMDVFVIDIGLDGGLRSGEGFNLPRRHQAGQDGLQLTLREKQNKTSQND